MAGETTLAELRIKVAYEDLEKVAEHLAKVSPLVKDVTVKTRDLESESRRSANAQKEQASATKAQTGALWEFTRQLGTTLVSLYTFREVWNAIKYVTGEALRYETLGTALRQIGTNAGYTTNELKQFQSGLESTGISMLQARQSMIRLINSNIDLSKSTALARAAQDLAVISGENSSDTFERLAYAIQSGSIVMLRNLGINVSFQQAYKKLADELHTTTGALTENQKVQARLNAILDDSTKRVGLYEEAMLNAGKQLTTMQRLQENFAVMVGRVFRDTASVAVQAWMESLKDANAELRKLTDDQVMAVWSREMVTFFSSIANAVDNMVTRIRQLISVLGGWGQVLSAVEANTPGGIIGMMSPVTAGIGVYRAQDVIKQINAETDAEVYRLGANIDRVDKAKDRMLAAIDAAKRARDDFDRAIADSQGEAVGPIQRRTGATDEPITTTAQRRAAEREAQRVASLLNDQLMRNAKEALKELTAAQKENEKSLDEMIKTRDKAMTSAEQGLRAYEQETAMLRMTKAEREAYLYGLKLEADGIKQNTDLYQSYMDRFLEAQKQRKELQDNFFEGARIGFQAYADQARDTSKLTAEFFERAFQATEDAWVKFVTTGKISWKEFMQSVAADFARMTFKQNIGGPLSQFLGNVAGQAGNWLSELINPTTFLGGGTWYGMQQGGSFTVGGDGGVDTTPVAFMATRGENVTVTPAGEKPGGDTYIIDARGADQTSVNRLYALIERLNGTIETRALTAVYQARARGSL